MDQKLKKICLDLAKAFDQHDLIYHFDGDTGRVLQGTHETPEDVDIVFPYYLKEKVREILKAYQPSQEAWMDQHQLAHFRVTMADMSIHLLFYKDGGDSFYDYHESILLEGYPVWVKGLGFFEGFDA